LQPAGKFDISSPIQGSDDGSLPMEGPMTLMMRVADRAATARCVAGTRAVGSPFGLAVPPAAALGSFPRFADGVAPGRQAEHVASQYGSGASIWS
jgi:hypothetical protein